MRVLITGIPGDRQYSSDFKARADFLARVVREQGHKVRNTARSSRRKLLGVFKGIADGKFDAVIFENSMEERPDIPIAFIAGLVKEREIPVLFLRPEFFNDGVIYSGGGGDRRMSIKDFCSIVSKEGCRIWFQYYYGELVEPKDYNEPANCAVKRVIRDFFIEGVREKESPVLSGREREV